MKKREYIQLVLQLLAAVVIVAANSAVWVAARRGAIPAIDNVVLWGAFAGFGTLSILWATRLLGLQPMLVALSYVGGGLLAGLGVRGHEFIGIADAAVAGAVYGAWGSLIAGNAIVRERSAGYCKEQRSFVFMLFGLLVLDGMLVSGIWRADTAAIINGLVLPLAGVGVVCGVLWFSLARLRMEPVPVFAQEPKNAVPEEIKSAEPVPGIVLQMPEENQQERVELQPVPVPEITDPPELQIEPEDENGRFFPLELDAVGG